MAHFLAPPTREVIEEDSDFDDDDEDEDFDDDETIAMTDAAVVELLREHFMGADSFYIAPSIPPKKEKNVRAMHAAHLPPHEPILGIYDGTVFGAADDGFVITSRRLCWRNMMEPPQMVEWHYLDADSIHTDGNKIVMRAARIDTIADEDSGFMDACEEVLPILARSGKKAMAGGGHRAPQQGQPMQHGYGPQAQQGYAPPVQQGYGPAGQQHGYGAYVAPQQHGYGPPSQHGYGGYGPPSQQGGYGHPHQQGYGGGYGAPQQQPVYGCWHCRSPLHWQAHQCGRCGATPGPQGWLRLA